VRGQVVPVDAKRKVELIAEAKEQRKLEKEFA
jgi:hypothetical protein